jgi:hypothetical protein
MHLKREALHGVLGGGNTLSDQIYLDLCSGFHSPSGIVVIYTRDVGMHTSGWFKNPDYERCLHLSLSFKEPMRPTVSLPFDSKAAAEWVDIFFGENKRYAWFETPKSRDGREMDVRHWRVFCDEYWQPILPRKEVYTTEFTEKGWKSFSEVYPDDPRKEPSTLYAG